MRRKISKKSAKILDRYGERLGTGIPKTRHISRQEGYPEPQFHVSENEVHVLIRSRFWNPT
ncbi:hypothetical protein L0244_35910 [bacterium]|nr:hypothetical protein [bacterium]